MHDQFQVKHLRNRIMAQVSKDPLDVSSEFIESGKLSKTKSKKRGGPYSKDEKSKRQEEVYRLHFEYGYSARKISELMKISRNTINNDIGDLYSRVFKNYGYFNAESYVVASIERFEFQRTRLRERLDKVENFQQIHTIEKMLFDIDCKLINIHVKIADSVKRIHKIKIDHLNAHLKDNGETIRYMNLFDKLSVSEKAHEKISKIIKDDRFKTSY